MLDAGDHSASPAREARSVLVIGGAGYLGSALVPLLLARGHRVRVVDRLLHGRAALAASAGHPRLEVIETDFGSCFDLADLVDRSDDVVHLAAIVGDPACDLDPELAARVNVTSTETLMEGVRKVGPRRFVFASTCAVYEASRSILDERSPTGPRSLYARTKLAGEHVVIRGAGPRTAPTVLRFASMYGSSGRKRLDLVVNRFVAQALEAGRITLRGGKQRRPFVHVEDAARAIVAVLDADPDRIAGAILNVGSENFSISRVAELVARAVPEAVVAAEPDAPEDHDYCVSFTRLRQQTAFAPCWTLRSGIRQLVRALRTECVGDQAVHGLGGEGRLRARRSLARARSDAAS